MIIYYLHIAKIGSKCSFTWTSEESIAPRVFRRLIVITYTAAIIITGYSDTCWTLHATILTLCLITTVPRVLILMTECANCFYWPQI